MIADIGFQILDLVQRKRKLSRMTFPGVFALTDIIVPRRPRGQFGSTGVAELSVTHPDKIIQDTWVYSSEVLTVTSQARDNQALTVGLLRKICPWAALVRSSPHLVFRVEI